MNQIVREYLIKVARKKTNQLVTYQKLSDDCNLGLNMRENPNDRITIGNILDSISRFEHSNDRPLLSSLVVRASDNFEGNGFYKLGESLGFGKWEKLKKDGIFEFEQIRDCINFWTDENKYLHNI